MTDALENALPGILKLLRSAVFGKGRDDNARLLAIKEIERRLVEVGADGQDLLDRLENPPFDRVEGDRIYNLGRQHQAEEIEEQQRAATPLKRAPTFNGAGIYDFDVGDRIVGDELYRGYDWLAIAQHCAANANRIPEKHRSFVQDMADKLDDGGSISGAQAKYLGNLFDRYLLGRI